MKFLSRIKRNAAKRAKRAKIKFQCWYYGHDPDVIMIPRRPMIIGGRRVHPNPSRWSICKRCCAVLKRRP